MSATYAAPASARAATSGSSGRGRRGRPARAVRGIARDGRVESRAPTAPSQAKRAGRRSRVHGQAEDRPIEQVLAVVSAPLRAGRPVALALVGKLGVIRRARLARDRDEVDVPAARARHGLGRGHPAGRRDPLAHRATTVNVCRCSSACELDIRPQVRADSAMRDPVRVALHVRLEAPRSVQRLTMISSPASRSFCHTSSPRNPAGVDEVDAAAERGDQLGRTVGRDAQP